MVHHSLHAALAGAAAAIAFASVARAASHARSVTRDDFDWNSVSPTWNLTFTACYEAFQCARLLTPVDWLEEDAGRRHGKTMALAIVRLPANLSSAASDGGTVIMNPGGPGASGVLELVQNGHVLRDFLDGENKRFAVMSFDPRGVAFSTPAGDCFKSETARALYNAQMTASTWPYVTGEQGLGDAALARSRANAQALGHQCKLPGPDGYVVQEYMSTTSVARDMLHMVDELEKLRKREQQQSDRHRAQKPLDDGAAKLPRLQYIGFSYGTMLGNMFISMFPGRVKRMILDGNLVPDNILSLHWSGNLVDTSKTLDHFYQSCFDAKSRCALFDAADDSWADVKARVTRLRERLDTDPVPVVFGKRTGKAPTILHGGHVVRAMSAATYSPLDKNAPLAKALAEAINGNYTSLIDLSGLGGGQGVISDACDGRNRSTKASEYAWEPLVFRAILCGDADDPRNVTLDRWREEHRRSISNSPEMGPAWSNMNCIGWQARPKFRFTGPFTSPDPDPSDRDGHPLAPVLFLTNRLDPITPLANARQAALAHPGSRVLVQNSSGHCTAQSSPSKCTKKIVGAYMDTGEMPVDGAECPGDCVPFQDCPYQRPLPLR